MLQNTTNYVDDVNVDNITIYIETETNKPEKLTDKEELWALEAVSQ